MKAHTMVWIGKNIIIWTGNNLINGVNLDRNIVKSVAIELENKVNDYISHQSEYQKVPYKISKIIEFLNDDEEKIEDAINEDLLYILVKDEPTQKVGKFI